MRYVTVSRRSNSRHTNGRSDLRPQIVSLLRPVGRHSIIIPQMASSASPATLVYIDEEDCLGLEVFLAELELIIGASKGGGGGLSSSSSSKGSGRPDQVQLLELLPKLAATIPRYVCGGRNCMCWGA